MNNHITTSDVGAGFTSLLSMASASFAMVTMDNVHSLMSMMSSAIAIISGFLSARYFYIQGKKIK